KVGTFLAARKMGFTGRLRREGEKQCLHPPSRSLPRVAFLPGRNKRFGYTKRASGSLQGMSFIVVGQDTIMALTRPRPK
ncbi:MAG TPA: hypothetical protein PKE06_05875, partial [Flavilitoribacter sp.]|nr:hypothetical protein [Flavilitoribacter sp.]